MAQSKAYDKNAGQWPKYSDFKPVRADCAEIRLLQPETGQNTTELRYVICHAELRRSPKFYALSYAWGAPVPDSALKEIFIHGKAVRIRPTLYSLLETMKMHDSDSNLWIDAICINQGNVQERNHQISIMGEIFRTAQEVYVWLGPGDDDTSYAIAHIDDSLPQTHFDSDILSMCAEKLLRASYWSRRWIIQEFTLAQDLTIVCGKRLTKWRHFITKVDDEVLKNDAPALRTLRNFKEMRLLSLQNQMNMLELMERFQNARCIDLRDKAFALRGIAKDGDLLPPRYNESAADLYFRLLSMLTTERVLPATLGYRWPHQAGNRLQKCMQITKQDMFKSSMGHRDDRLFTVFEYVDRIATVQDSSQHIQGPHPTNTVPCFHLKVRLQDPDKGVLRGSGSLKSGDLVYSLQCTPRSPKGIYLSFRPSRRDQMVVGVLIEELGNYWADIERCEKKMELIRDIILHGVLKCQRNRADVPLSHRVLCHTSRLMLILLWLLDSRQVGHLWNCQQEIFGDLYQEKLLCDCTNDRQWLQGLSSETGEHQDMSLEILPSFTFQQDQAFWAEKLSLPWFDPSQQSQQKPPQLDKFQGQSKVSVDFSYSGRTGLSYAAEDGLVLFAKHFLSEKSVNVNSLVDQKTPLWWAAYNGHTKLVSILLDTGADVNAHGQQCGTAIQIASDRGYGQVVRMLLGTGADINAQGGYSNALQAASYSGHKEIVGPLLDSGADVNARGVYGDALQAASYRGQEELVKLLLDSGADVNAHRGEFGTALYAASDCGHESVVKLLLDAEADVNAQGGYHRHALALYIASEHGHEGVVRLLLDAGSMVNTEGGYCPSLRMAFSGGHSEVVKILLDAGAVLKENIVKIRLASGRNLTLSY